MGYFPEKARPRSLVWDSNTGALYAAYHTYDLGSSTNVLLQLFCWFPGRRAIQG